MAGARQKWHVPGLRGGTPAGRRLLVAVVMLACASVSSSPSPPARSAFAGHGSSWGLGVSPTSASIECAGVGCRTTVMRLRGGGGNSYLDTCFGRSCPSPPLSPLFPLPWFSIMEPSEETLRSIASRISDVKPVPMRGSTNDAILYLGRRLNPAVFPPDAFINERRIFLNKLYDFRAPPPPKGKKQTVFGTEYRANGQRCFERAKQGLSELSFLDVGWCKGVREGDQITIGSRVFGVWMAMTNRVIRETFTEDKDHARATLTFAMTRSHLLVGEEMLAVHWDKKSDAVAFEVCSFSWPQHPFAALSQPIVHQSQRKAADAFCMRMQEVVKERVFKIVEGRLVETSAGKGIQDPVWPL